MINHLLALHSFFMKVSLSVSRMADVFLASLLLPTILAPSLDKAKLCRSSSELSLISGCFAAALSCCCGIASSAISCKVLFWSDAQLSLPAPLELPCFYISMMTQS